MNNAPPSLALSPRPEASSPASLDERIRAVELRLVARERALVSQFRELGDRLRRVARPRQLAPALLGIGAAIVVLSVELGLAIAWLGNAYERFDLSAELRP